MSAAVLFRREVTNICAQTAQIRQKGAASYWDANSQLWYFWVPHSATKVQLLDRVRAANVAVLDTNMYLCVYVKVNCSLGEGGWRCVVHAITHPNVWSPLLKSAQTPGDPYGSGILCKTSKTIRGAKISICSICSSSERRFIPSSLDSDAHRDGLNPWNASKSRNSQKSLKYK